MNTIKSKKHYAYKLVLKGSNSSVSYYSVVRYHLNKWVKPNIHAANQFLFCFKNRKSARNFKKFVANAQIYRCEVLKPNLYRKGIGYFKGSCLYFKSELWPEGTIFVNAVKLLKKVS